MARDADLATITAALDRALAERPFAGPPAGSELVDTPTLNQLKEEAEAGRTSRVREELNSALREGRMRPADRRAGSGS